MWEGKCVCGEGGGGGNKGESSEVRMFKIYSCWIWRGRVNWCIFYVQDVGSLGVVGAVEDVCLDAFAALVVKLSEVQFRPVLLKLLDWACSSKASRARLITFYHLADR